jgi:hypothetical protein
MNQENANNGSRVSIISIVARLKGVNQEAFFLYPGRATGFSLLQTMQIGYGSHTTYYSMGAGDKAA